MTRTITAFFDDRSDAMRAIERLASIGVPRNSIRILPDTESGTVSSMGTGQAHGMGSSDSMGSSSGMGSSPGMSSSSTTGSTSYDARRDEKGFWESLGDFFFPDEDRYTYAEAMNRGDVMVTATVDDQFADMAEDILEADGTVNIDERESSWRNEGWTGWAGYSGTDRGSSRMDSDALSGDYDDRSASEREGVIPIAEEEMRVGKRDVSRGRVKVRSYVVDTPVSEDVSLREESVHVERRPADRALSQGEGEDLFRERTIEVEERGEEAVVSKTARVREELAVGKTVEERTETIRDNVRHTEVEVEDDRTGHGISGDGKRRAS